MISISSLVAMAVATLVAIGLPVALAWYMVRRHKVPLKTIIIGAVVFVVFALGLESVAHHIILKGPMGESIMSRVWSYALYGGFMAALFEEAGRFITMKWLLRAQPSGLRPALGYGIGHGGVEMMLIFGISMISNLVLSLMLNSGQAETLLASTPAEAQEQVQAQFDTLRSLNCGMVALGLWERFSALFLQICLSLLMWTAVRRGGRWLWLALVPFLIHFLVDTLAVVLSRSTGMFEVEVYIFAMVLAIAAITWLLVRPRQIIKSASSF
ncbi:MAG: YhfC family intramembrane metalloprotease [Bacteroidales bacterium]|nr:YhfC family intramembrane metalloprotease [Bacteroidales bacterium]